MSEKEKISDLLDRLIDTVNNVRMLAEVIEALYEDIADLRARVAKLEQNGSK